MAYSVKDSKGSKAKEFFKKKKVSLYQRKGNYKITINSFLIFESRFKLNN